MHNTCGIMRYILVFSVFVFSVFITKQVTDINCLKEEPQEICESFGLGCGSKIRMTNYCGDVSEVKCVCQAGEIY